MVWSLRAILLTGLLTSLWLGHPGVVQAASSTLESFQLTRGVLELQTPGRSQRPELSIWPSRVGQYPTQMIILILPAVSGDIGKLQALGNQLLVEHPHIKRFLISDADHPEGGLKLVLDVVLPKSEPTPTLIQTAQGWGVQLSPSATEQPQKPPLQTSTSSPTSPLGLGQTAHAPLNPETLQARDELRKVTEQLQTVIQERDALTRDLNRLQQVAQAQQAEQTDRRALVDDMIRAYGSDTWTPQARLETTLTNLRTALFNLAVKHKATEQALQTQTQKTKLLAAEINKLKPNTILLDDPWLETPIDTAQREESPEKVLAQAIQNARKERQVIEEQVIYEPKPDNQRVYESPTNTPEKPKVFSRADELVLQATIRENPKQPTAYLQLAQLYQANQQFDRAESTLSRLIRKNPTYGQGYYHLAALYVQQARKTAALAALTTYQRLNPSDTEKTHRLMQAIQALPDGKKR